MGVYRLGIEAMVTKFGISGQQHRDEFVPACLELGVEIHIDNPDHPAVLTRDGFEGIEHYLAQMAPFTA